MRQIAPYKEKQRLVFEIDMDSPEINSAVSSFRQGDVTTGIKFLELGLAKPNTNATTRAKFYYNIGVARIMEGDFTKAIESFKKARSLNIGSQRYPKAIKYALAESEKAKRLSEQNE